MSHTNNNLLLSFNNRHLQYDQIVITPNIMCTSFQTWDRRNTCLYAGNQNGGTVYEVVDDHDTLIEGVYKQYIMESAFSTEFEFSQFNQTCST